MKRIINFSLLAIVAFSFVFTACKKSNELDSDLSTTEDQSSAEFNFDQVFKQVDGSATDAGLKKGGFPIVTFDTVSSNKSMTIDYGTTNYLCNDGNYRRGKILVTWTGKYRQEGTVISVGFDKFYQNDNHIEGTKSVTNNGRNTQDQMYFTVVVDGKVTTSSNEVITWKSNRVRTWIAGESTKEWNDDKYTVSGTTTGVNRKGNNFTSKTTTPLTVDLSCQWRITAGVMEVTPEGKATRTLDFGNGACDKLVTVTVNGKTFTFTRRK